MYAFDQLRVGTNTVTFADELDPLEAPGTVTVTNPTTASAGRAIVIGAENTHRAVLNTSLADFSGVAATLGDAPDAWGTLNVTGGTFSVTGSSPTHDELVIGYQGLGLLNVTGGGHVNVQRRRSDDRTRQAPRLRGYIYVDGPGSQFITAGELVVREPVGLDHVGQVYITNGGLLSSASATLNYNFWGEFSPFTFSILSVDGVASMSTDGGDVLVRSILDLKMAAQ